MAKYVRIDEIKKFLANKVRFAAAGDNDENKISKQFLDTLVNQAESQFEIDLMSRYLLPLQGPNGTFAELPDSTRYILIAAAEMLCVIRILETDFGRGTSVNGDKYTSALQKRYEGMVNQLTEIKKDSYSTWLRPPLPELALAYCNQGDSGFRGKIHNTTTLSHEADYAYKQINSPGETLFDGWLDPLDRGRDHG